MDSDTRGEKKEARGASDGVPETTASRKVKVNKNNGISDSINNNNSSSSSRKRRDQDAGATTNDYLIIRGDKALPLSSGKTL